MKIVIIGLGLMGGSFARALGRQGGHTIAACDRDESTLAAALADGVIHTALTDETLPAALAEAGLVLCCLRPGDTVTFFDTHLAHIAPDAILADIAGVKRPVCDTLFPAARQVGRCFFGGHPMAGRERGGYAHSDAALFDGASFLFVRDPGRADDSAYADKASAFIELLRSLGFAGVLETDAATHDQRVAYTSQLAHLTACAYMLDPLAKLHHGYSAGSYRDLSRVARLDPEMWAELFTLNRDNLDAILGHLIDHLSDLREAVNTDPVRLRELLAEGNRIKEETLT